MAAVATEAAGLLRADLSATPPVLATVTLTGDTRLQSLALSLDGARLAAGSVDGRVFLVAGDGPAAEIAQGAGSVTALAFDPSGERLAAACSGTAICLYALGDDGPELVARLAGHGNTILSLAFDEDGTRLASASVDGSVKYWTIDSVDATTFALAAPGAVPLTDLDLSPDGRWLAAGGAAGAIFVWDLPARSFAGALPTGREGEVRSLRWAPDRPWLAAVDDNGFAVVRDWPEGEVVEERRIDESVIEAIRWLPDGKALVVGTLGGTVRLWPLGGEPADFGETHPEPVQALATLPGDRLASADALGNVWLWDVPGRKRIEIAWPKAEDALDTVAVDHGGTRLLVAGNSGIVSVYDVATPGAPRRIDLASRQIDGAAWSPDDGRIAAVDTEGNLKVWSLAEEKLAASARIYGAVAADGSDEEDGGHLRRMTWLPASEAVAIATAAGEVVVVSLDPAAWLARARAVFGIAAPVEQSAPVGEAAAAAP